MKTKSGTGEHEVEVLATKEKTDGISRDLEELKAARLSQLLQVDEDELRPFEASGYRFFRRPEGREPPPPSEGEKRDVDPLDRLVRTADGLAIVGKVYVIEAAPQKDEQAVRVYLEELGFEEVRRVEFAPNMYMGRARSVVTTELKRFPLGAPILSIAPSLLRHAKGSADDDSRARDIPTGGADGAPAAPWQFESMGIDPHDAGGAGTVAAVIDFGFDLEHWALRGTVKSRAVVRADPSVVVDEDAPIYPQPGRCHGTAVAGMCVGRPSSTESGGAAPGAQLIPIKVGDGTLVRDEEIAYAIAHAVDRGADVLVLTLGRGTSWSISPLLRLALWYAAAHGRKTDEGDARGMAIFYAVPNAYVDLRLDELAGSRFAINVGGHDPAGDRITCAYGPELDVLAPGWLVEGPRWANNGGLLWGQMSGTSFAAPLAAGLALRYLADKPNTEAYRLRLDLLRNARPYGYGHTFEKGYGLVRKITR